MCPEKSKFCSAVIYWLINVCFLCVYSRVGRRVCARMFPCTVCACVCVCFHFSVHPVREGHSLSVTGWTLKGKHTRAYGTWKHPCTHSPAHTDTQKAYICLGKSPVAIARLWLQRKRIRKQRKKELPVNNNLFFYLVSYGVITVFSPNFLYGWKYVYFSFRFFR